MKKAILKTLGILLAFSFVSCLSQVYNIESDGTVETSCSKD